MSNVTLDKKTLAIIMVACILVSSLISTSLVQFGVITPEQGEAVKSMIQQLMRDLNLTYEQVTSALEIEVGSKLYGLAGDYDYLLCHPLGDTSITAIKNGTSGAWDYWSANFSDVFMRANILMNKETYGGTLAIKAGNYSVTNTLVFGPPTYDRTKPTMLKMSPGTWLTLANNANCDVLSDYYTFYGNGSEPCAITISGGNIDGNRAHNTQGNGIRSSTAYGTIENINIYEMAEKGIWLYSPVSATGTQVTNAHITNCSYGIYTSGGATDSRFSDCNVYYNDVDGFFCSAANPMITQSSIYSNGRYGVYVMGVAWAEICNNWIGSNNNSELRIYGPGTIWATAYQITGNTFYRGLTSYYTGCSVVSFCGREGYPVYGLEFTGNNVWDRVGKSQYAMDFEYSVTNSSITGNVFEGQFQAGVIHFGNAVSGLKFYGNTGYNSTGVNRLYGITCTTATWDNAPTNLGAITDGSWSFSSVTTTGNRTITGSGQIGYLYFDMGAYYTVTLSAQIGQWSSTGTSSTYWIISNDGGSTYVTVNGLTCTSVSSVSEQYRWATTVRVYARYVGLRFDLGAAGTGYIKIYEVQAMDYFPEGIS